MVRPGTIIWNFEIIGLSFAIPINDPEASASIHSLGRHAELCSRRVPSPPVATGLQPFTQSLGEASWRALGVSHDAPRSTYSRGRVAFAPRAQALGRLGRHAADAAPAFYATARPCHRCGNALVRGQSAPRPSWRLPQTTPKSRCRDPGCHT